MQLNEKGLTEAIASALSAVIEHGFNLPIYCVIIGSDGSLMAWHYISGNGPDLDCRMIAEHLENGIGLRFPINMFFSDSSGTAERFLFETEKITNPS
jgi:hypothetical protein